MLIPTRLTYVDGEGDGASGQLTIDEQAYNAIHSVLRCTGERANSLLKTTYKALRRYRDCPGDWAAPTLICGEIAMKDRFG